MFANHASLNHVWNFGHTISQKANTSNPYKAFTDKDAENFIYKTKNELLESNYDSILTTQKPNVILIIWESLSAKVVGSLGGEKEVTPNLNRLSEEGILFTNFYANGDRTDKGIPAILSGYYPQPTRKIIKVPSKARNLPMLPKEMNKLGYTSSFYYGGDLNFGNMNTYLLNADITNFVDGSYFDSKDWNSKWGAYDDVFMKKFAEDLSKKQREPFFKIALTLSSHEPFEIKGKYMFGKDNADNLYRSSHYYTDKVIGNFVAFAKKQPWYKNTIIIIMADHGHSSPKHEGQYFAPIKFQIPMLWLGGAVNKNLKEVDAISSQVDFSYTLLDLLGGDNSKFVFGKNLFNKNNNYSKEDIKKIFISRTESLNSKNNNNYYSLIDIKTNKVILNNQKKLLNLDVSKFVDLDGRQIILMENVYDKFLKLKLTKSDNDEKRYNKIIYIKKLEELDLAVIYGEYIDDINLEIQNKILSDVLYYDFENNPYIFIIKIFDFNRDSNYGEVILHHAKPELVGKKLSLNNSDRRVDDYRRDYIQKLKNYGEGFVTYYYSRPDSNKISQKMSYFYLQKDWNWALGAGFYFDDLDESIKDFRIKIKLQTKDNVNAAIILSIFLTILISIILFFISNRINKIIGDYSQNLKDSNEQLKKQKDIFETLFEKSSDGILIYNENGDIINCNDSLVRIFGYEDKEFLLGKNYLEFSPKLQFKDELSNKKAKLINKICFDNKKQIPSINQKKLFLGVPCFFLLKDV